MKKTNYYYLLGFLLIGISLFSCKSKDKKDSNKMEVSDVTSVWAIDFLDEFETFNPDNWQDQRI